MRPDKFRKRFQGGRASDRLRRQIATEAAKRLLPALVDQAEGPLREIERGEYYAAKRKAAAVLGQTVRPGDLPSDSEVREQVLALRSSWSGEADPAEDAAESRQALQRLADHVDRFTIYRMRLLPLEQVKQDPRDHPEGDALYHSLQVFEQARERRPYDEEFLLAALLHDVGKAIDPRNHVAAGLEALAGTLTERTAWLIGHHHDLMGRAGRPLGPRERQELEQSPWYDDLELLREVDEAGTAVGVPVPGVDEALAHLRGLERETYLAGHESERDQEG